MTDLKALELLVKMKELGISKADIDAFKVEYSPKEQEMDADKLLRDLFPQYYTDEEILYYATPYFDELQVKKEIHNQKIKEETLNEHN